ncbi:COPII vesicle coat protein [Schizosaccharomyces cryophilus OY26]|uniref:COPII vesicle coat protein n=1 Tax=Schizosaccharomyces cryophilus (strain OY26 / ATCC MYA-4695 / CBS 11777 / NBRC 106824 / NRRL Y48691) TaxID=653667 RepID=S9VVY5_SCHCR|nr:COPII vesicle coat protein [Schizosaccharomyces cryophilus OY26]EPY50354.1 COPII vesicle coat protein [Schizosaccharomyces cryophilus OY26]
MNPGDAYDERYTYGAYSGYPATGPAVPRPAVPQPPYAAGMTQLPTEGMNGMPAMPADGAAIGIPPMPTDGAAIGMGGMPAAGGAAQTVPTMGSSHRSRRQYPAEIFELTNSQTVPMTPPPVSEPSYLMARTPTLSPYPEAAPNALATQMGNVNLGPDPNAAMMPTTELVSIDLYNQTPEISDLYAPPLPINLPLTYSATQAETSNCPPKYMRTTLKAIPNTNSLLKKSKLPFAIVLRPYTSLLEEDDPVPVVSDTIISRCRRCRMYINPFSIFVDNGHRYRCNSCGIVNEVPQSYDWDSFRNVQRDRWQRPELNYAVVDFLAPQEYMVRPPQPLIYVFLIDVSFISISSGMVATATRTILESLDRIPNKEGRTQVAFIGVDSSLHFFSIAPGAEEASQMVVSDLDDPPFLPRNQDLLLNLRECRQGIENLLTKFNSMFASTRDSSNALGPALKAAQHLIENIGGKICCFVSSLPNVGSGKLSLREDPKLLGTNRESNLLHHQDAFYKSFAVECSTNQVSVDMFLFSSQYQDVATLSCLPRYTAGKTQFYYRWNASRSEDALKFASELSDYLSSEVALEAVMRVRGSSGIRMSSFYGNFFNRSSDLCAFPSFPRDQCYVIEAVIEDTITKPFASFQAAILHTTSSGERRIRVVTLSLPVTNSLTELYASADQLAMMHVLTMRATEKALSSNLSDARDGITNKLIEILEVYKKNLAGQNTGAALPLQICTNLKLLPLLCLSLMKHTGFRKSSHIPSDLRSIALCNLSTLPTSLLTRYVYPTLYSLHDMPLEAGTVAEDGVILPPALNLTSAIMQTFGLYLLDTHFQQFLYIGKDAVPQLAMDAFGVSSIAELKAGRFTLPILDNPLNTRMHAILGKLRSLDKGTIVQPSLYLVRGDGDPQLRSWFFSHFVEDRSDTAPSYLQFLQLLKEKVRD